MNLRALANTATRSVNPNIQASWEAYTGETETADYQPVPGYAAPQTITVQQQALTQNDILFIDGMNLQGVHTKIYANAPLSAIDRANGKGGDKISFSGRLWLVAVILEEWTRDGWIAAGLTGQLDNPVLS